MPIQLILKLVLLFCIFIGGILNSSSCDGANTVVIGNQTITEGASNVIVGSGNLVSAERTISSATKVVLNGAVDMMFSQGEKPYLKIKIDDNILPIVKTTVVGDTLSISTDKSYSSHSKIKVNLVLPGMQSLTLSGSGTAKLVGLDIPLLFLGIKGAGNIHGSGRVSQLNLEVSGTGDVNGYELESQHVELIISGAGNIKTFAKQSIRANISGVGSVFVKGKPTVRKSRITGVGKVNFD